MRIERFDPATDSDRVGACYEMCAAAHPVDDPKGPPWSLPAFAGWWARGCSGQPREAWLAAGPDGDPIGCYLLELPEPDNTRNAWLDVFVRLASRRAGLGSRLLQHAAARAADAGRAVLFGYTVSDSPGAAFAQALGARRGLVEIRRVLDLAGIPTGHLDRLRERATAAGTGYSLVSWQGPVPGEYLNQVAAVNAAMADAPRSDAEEPDHWDVARIRAAELTTQQQGMRSHSVAARCDATGELAALTQVGVDPLRPAWGFQGNTAVTRPHRGHRLGLAIKVAMMDLLAQHEPSLETVITGNGETNQHMIAINAELGYRVLDREVSWEIDVARVTGSRAEAPRRG